MEGGFFVAYLFLSKGSDFFNAAGANVLVLMLDYILDFSAIDACRLILFKDDR